MWDKQNQKYWSEQFTLLELGMSNRFPSSSQKHFEIWPVEEQEYYIVVKDSTGEYALFWKSNKQGFTHDLREAGIYTETEVKEFRQDENLSLIPVDSIDIDRAAMLVLFRLDT